MDFLENAFFSSESQKMLGLRITHYNPGSYVERASVKVYTLDELRANYESMSPCGWKLGEDGGFFADTSSRQIITDSGFEYLRSECGGVRFKERDMTDLVLLGVKENGYIFVNYESIKDRPENFVEKGIFIPFNRFKVSNSSLNIYAPYLNVENKFRTYSLLDSNIGGPIRVYVVFPEEVDILGEFTQVSLVDNIELEEAQYSVYACDLGLVPFYSGVGEAFLNYLAFNVAHFDIGEQVLKEFQRSVTSVGAKQQRPKEPYTPKEPSYKMNVSIKHRIKKHAMEAVTVASKNPDMLRNLLATDPAAAVTYHWMCIFKSAPWIVEKPEDQSYEQAVLNCCDNLLYVCRKEKLCYALELLTHRYYICSQGFGNDILGNDLKGGGVLGGSVKQSNFGYR